MSDIKQIFLICASALIAMMFYRTAGCKQDQIEITIQDDLSCFENLTVEVIGRPHLTTIYTNGYDSIQVEISQLVGVDSVVVKGDSIWADGVLVDTFRSVE